MDPTLLKEREQFRKKSLSTPTVKKRQATSDSGPLKKKKPPFEERYSWAKQSLVLSFNTKTRPGSRFGNLVKIVRHMKARYLGGNTHFLTLDEIQEETRILNIGTKEEEWLYEALLNNPKIEVQNGMYSFKPKYKLKNKKALMRLLKENNRKGLGGVFQEDIEEGLPNAAKAIKNLGDRIIFVKRSDKRKVMFYNDVDDVCEVDEKFKKLWRSVPVESIDEDKIEEYLKIQGISSMQGTGKIKVLPVKKRKQPLGRRKRLFKTHNTHLEDVLEDYSDGVPVKK